MEIMKPYRERIDALDDQIVDLLSAREAVIKEVGLYFEYKLYRGNRTTKINAEYFQAFASLNFPALITSGVHLNVQHELLLKNYF